MVSSTSRLSFRVVFCILLLVAAFYVGRPLYWKLSATIHDIRRKKQTVQQGFSQFILDAQRSVGWVSDSVGISTNRRALLLLGSLDSKTDSRR